MRILARRPRRDPGLEWIKGDLATGEGVREAVAGVQTVVHAATNSPAARRGRFKLGDFLGSPADVDVAGTKMLLRAAEQAKVDHFVHVSIAGLEHLRRMPYARRKLQAEQLVRSSNVPWSIVRATAFYWLLERMFENTAKRRILALPAHAGMAPVDSDEFAEFVVECVGGGPRGECEDFAGPQTLTTVELMEQYLRARGPERRIRRAPLPRKLQAAMTAGNTSTDARRGSVTWAQWLQRSVDADRPVHRFRAALEARDVSAAVTLLADDVRFRSPVVFKPYHGRDAVREVLAAVFRVFDEWRCVREIGAFDGRDHGLVFQARIGDRQVEGCDFLHVDEHGSIDEFYVMVRPLSGALALAETMKAQLAAEDHV